VQSRDGILAVRGWKPATGNWHPATNPDTLSLIPPKKDTSMTTILIVEDYPVTQRVLGTTLRNEGYTVVIAAHGLEALEALANTAVDLALVDIAMPEMDGLTLLQHLRADPRYRQLPVVMLTASGQDEDRAQALALGANGFLTKPASSQELVSTISQFV
jgi:CheY-like chemotaxis protein